MSIQTPSSYNFYCYAEHMELAYHSPILGDVTVDLSPFLRSLYFIYPN